MVDQINDSVAVAILVVIPGHKLDEGSRQLNSSLGIEDRGPVISKEVRRDHHVLSVSKNPCILDS